MPDNLPPDPPTNAELRGAHRIDLSRHPASPTASALTAAVMSLAIKHKATTRAVSRRGLPTWQRDVGAILAGLLKADVVSAHRNTHGPMWKDGLAIGYTAFWTKIDALHRAGLIGIERGTQTKHALIPGAFAGHPTKLWTLPALRDLAASHGIVAKAWSDDWMLSLEAQAARPAVLGDLVVLRPLKVRQGSYWVENGPPIVIPREWEAKASDIQAGLERLNAVVAAADIRGVVPPIFVRRFRHDLRLGGRFFTPGDGGFSNMRKADRAALTIAGEAAVEVDLSASQPTLYLALTDPGRLNGGRDLYDLPGYPASVVKAFFIQTLGTGRPILKWSDDTPADVRPYSVKAVRDGVLSRYPTMKDIVSILPNDIATTLPEDRRGWAAGQHVAFLESQILADALGRLMDQGVVALPLHDAVVVPASAVEAAKEALEAAFMAWAGVRPRIKVKA